MNTERDGGDRGPYERFAIPYTFKPQLTFLEALIGTAGAFLRISLGSLLFALWGAYSLAAWATIRSPVWRICALVPLGTLFLLSFVLLMRAISALVKSLSPKHL